MLSRVLGIALLLLVARSASAQTDAAGALEYALPNSKKPASPPYVHDGVYASFHAGPSYFSASAEPRRTATVTDPGSREFTGPSLAMRFAVGGTFKNRVVIGVMLGFEPLLSLTAKDETGAEFDTYGAKFVLLQQGALIDYYFLPRGGFHVLGSAGLTQLAVNRTEVEQDDSEDPSGTYWLLGFGHEWWIGDDASVGLLASVTDGSLQVDERTKVDVDQFSFGLALTATIN